MGFLLYIIATILFIPLTILNIIFVVWKHAKIGSFWKTVNGYFMTGAVDIDSFGNHNFRTLWNTILRKSGGYAFGNKNETISSALGKNQRDKTLSFVGRGLANLLDWLDEDHCKKSINIDV
jgi:hypothetical protein